MIRGTKGFNREGVSKLIAMMGNDLVDVDIGTGYSLNMNPNKNVEFEVFLESLFYQNFSNTPLSYDGSSWTSQHCRRMPVGTYLKNYGSRLYTAYVKINGTNYPSRVMYSDLPKNNTIQWGFEYGTAGRATANTPYVGDIRGGFKAHGIKVGDPLLIESGSNAGEYTVEEVLGDPTIKLTENLPATDTSMTYWVGGNWFDVRTDNNDVITWLGENSNNLIIFKNDSLHRYNEASFTMRTVKDAPGTSSGRSVVNLRGGTFYFHSGSGERTGIYLYDGTDSTRISNAIWPFIKAMSDAKKTSVVGWAEGDVLRWYLGDLEDKDEGIEINKAVVSLDLVTNAWSVDPIAHDISCATTIRESNRTNVLLGTDDDKILLTPSGYSHSGTAIHWEAETGVIYPRGANTVNVFTRAAVVSRKARGINLYYKLINHPLESSDDWHALGDLEHDRTEFLIPTRRNNAIGIRYRFEEIGSVEPNFQIESITTYSYPQRIVTPEIQRTI